MHPRRDLQPQRIQVYKARRVALVIRLRRVRFHRGDVRIVQAHRRFAPGRDDIPFVKLEPDGAGDILLGFGDKGLQRLALGREPESVVNELARTSG